MAYTKSDAIKIGNDEMMAVLLVSGDGVQLI